MAIAPEEAELGVHVFRKNHESSLSPYSRLYFQTIDHHTLTHVATCCRRYSRLD